MSGDTTLTLRELTSMFDFIRRSAAKARRRPRPSGGRHRRHSPARPSAAVPPEPWPQIAVPRQRRPQDADAAWPGSSKRTERT
ncbi:hypothetical protein SFRA_015930 [Streptomyces xinghaiensis]|uniref:Uncharacterized protein n=1 Tax=Streptomyces xinghaiensis TaxID=1038928 RepID=A0A3R7FTF6_9ACTN|nr:hypothetical protein SFRA_015930 [Streptomyces xinghaiensis]RNC74790.1 hypothetical protein DC095_009020 [Streptomyces xinghaiensis]